MEAYTDAPPQRYVHYLNVHEVFSIILPPRWAQGDEL